MAPLLHLHAQLDGLARLVSRLHPGHRSGNSLRRVRADRGDVPGWVLVTVMSAGLCAALYGVADEQLRQLLTSALDRVK
jgi:hypothetical protein